ncbi:hypothetical protein AB4343_06220, partial [Vibrio breoganii]
MKISKSVIAVAISSAFLFGCDFDVGSENNVTTPPGGGDGGGTGGGTGGGDEIVPGVNYFAQIQDNVKATSGTLRVKLEDTASDTPGIDSIGEGYLTVDFTFQEHGIHPDGEAENAYLQLHTNQGSSNSNLRADLIFNKSGNIQYRTPKQDGSGTENLDTGASFTKGEELNIKLSWNLNNFSFSLDGGTTVYGPFVSPDVGNPVQLITLKMGDSGSSSNGVSNYEVIADNLEIFKSTSSGDELVFEDDFDSYGNGHTLEGVRYNTATDVMVIGDDFIGDGGSD